MTQEEINVKLDLHQKWLNQEKDGVRADFYNENLKGLSFKRANLTNARFVESNCSEADFTRAILTGANFKEANCKNSILVRAKYRDVTLFIESKIVTINGLHYPIVKIKNYLRIGCEEHTIEEWKAFTNEQLLKMDGEIGFKFWQKYKNMLLNLQ